MSAGIVGGLLGTSAALVLALVLRAWPRRRERDPADLAVCVDLALPGPLLGMALGIVLAGADALVGHANDPVWGVPAGLVLFAGTAISLGLRSACRRGTPVELSALPFAPATILAFGEMLTVLGTIALAFVIFIRL